MGVRGDFSTIARFKSNLNAMPLSVAHDVASRAAPEINKLAQGAFHAGQTVFDEPRPAGEGGKFLTLHKTGATERELRFVSVGTIVRCVLGPRYSKYSIGKYKILPIRALPSKWSAKLRELVATSKVEP